MLLGLLVLLAALSISGVAIYYSIAGLVAIFAAAQLPIIVMGGVLEISKLITAVWLHKYWKRAVWWLKGYLSVAVIILMFITSMGIFGFLSKAHIEQTAIGKDNQAQLERINIEIARNQSIIDRSEEKIKKIELNGTSSNTNLQGQIDKEQLRVDSAYNRLNAANAALSTRLTPLETELSQIENSLNTLQTALTNNDIRKAQSIVGTNADGQLGSKTTQRINEYRNKLTNRRIEIVSSIEKIRSESPDITIARTQIEDGNALINRLREQIGQSTVQDVNALISEEQKKILDANSVIDNLTQDKYKKELEYRKLEAEVGPIKYIAEFVYGSNPTQDLLEEAVRWMIVIIIFVFDPLAVLLLIASQYTFRYIMVDSVRKAKSTIPIPIPASVKKLTQSLLNTFEDESEEEHEIEDVIPENGREAFRKKHYETLDTQLDWKISKQKWKEDHPNQTIKEYKNAYIRGMIDDLPWQDYEGKDSNISDGSRSRL